MIWYKWKMWISQLQQDLGKMWISQIESIATRFALTDEGKLEYYSGGKLEYKDQNTLLLHQRGHIETHRIFCDHQCDGSLQSKSYTTECSESWSSRLSNVQWGNTESWLVLWCFCISGQDQTLVMQYLSCLGIYTNLEWNTWQKQLERTIVGISKELKSKEFITPGILPDCDSEIKSSITEYTIFWLCTVCRV